MTAPASALRRSVMLMATLAVSVVVPDASAEIVRIDDTTAIPGLSLVSQGPDGVTLHYGMDAFGFDTVLIDGEAMQALSLAGTLLPNAPGAPNLPGFGRYIAIPQGATATLEIRSSTMRTYRDISVAPAPVIPKETDPTLIHEKDPAIFGRDAFYPESPVEISKTLVMRGVDVVIVRITPFQYNPVTKELIVYTHLDLRVQFHGGHGHFGEDRLRSRHWDPILREHLLNFASLPRIDFSFPRGPRGGNREGFEYVILTPDHPDFIAWGDSIKNWRNLQGISTEAFTTTDIGGTGPYTIWIWLRDIYATWDPAPAAFLLLGDAPDTGDGRDIGIEPMIWSGQCASDNMYADTGTYPDDLPDMAHGRICARNADELATMIGKMLSYERTPPTDPGFYNHPLFAGGWDVERWFIFCSEIVLGFQQNVLGKDPVREYAICNGTPGSIWSTYEHTNMMLEYFGPNGLGYIPATPDHLTDWTGDYLGITDALNSGAFFALHRDHGWEFGWGTPNWRISHLWWLHAARAPFIFSVNCLTGKYNHPYACFAEALHRHEEGALGVVAASEISYSFFNDVLVWGMVDGLWSDFDPGYPEATGQHRTENLGAADLRTAFAHVHGKYYLQAASWVGHNTRTYHLFHHHGGAFTQMYSEVPQDLTVIHGDFCPMHTATFTMQADAGALIGLTVDGRIIGATDATGEQQQVPIIPQLMPGTLRITVTKANHLRYDATVPIEEDQAIEEDPQEQQAQEATSRPLLWHNAPNPFTSSTHIRYAIPGPIGQAGGPVQLEVRDAAGRRVCTLVNEPQPAGTYSVSWDGTDQSGCAVPGGIYFCQLSAGGLEVAGRMLLVR
ncbi:MAG: hypothetical protein KAY24_14675 [Candidatus Eisenbacteria sp.]|nr:hypothetical protein [Candidatus Eisenbacteria bacterium]